MLGLRECEVAAGEYSAAVRGYATELAAQLPELAPVHASIAYFALEGDL